MQTYCWKYYQKMMNPELVLFNYRNTGQDGINHYSYTMQDHLDDCQSSHWPHKEKPAIKTTQNNRWVTASHIPAPFHKRFK